MVSRVGLRAVGTELRLVPRFLMRFTYPTHHSRVLHWRLLSFQSSSVKDTRLRGRQMMLISNHTTSLSVPQLSVMPRLRNTPITPRRYPRECALLPQHTAAAAHGGKFRLSKKKGDGMIRRDTDERGSEEKFLVCFPKCTAIRWRWTSLALTPPTPSGTAMAPPWSGCWQWVPHSLPLPHHGGQQQSPADG